MNQVVECVALLAGYHVALLLAGLRVDQFQEHVLVIGKADSGRQVDLHGADVLGNGQQRQILPAFSLHVEWQRLTWDIDDGTGTLKSLLSELWRGYSVAGDISQ